MANSDRIDYSKRFRGLPIQIQAEVFAVAMDIARIPATSMDDPVWRARVIKNQAQIRARFGESAADALLDTLAAILMGVPLHD